MRGVGLGSDALIRSEGVVRGTMSAPVALTGVPGTGKSSVAARLSSMLRSIEVSELAVRWGLALRRQGSLTVDLAGMRRRYRRNPPAVDLVVGHLAHLLPVRDVLVLRCHPEVLAGRLRRAGRGSAKDRRENYLAEALDLVLVEARGPGRRVWEVDTTRRSPLEVAQIVSRIVRHRPPPRYGIVNWLADPAVTKHLLDGTR
ncbi:MAG: AAA family ATPase [Thermoplasmata archaeon]|nr:AAA family ATPase [Thermoplasmata archaeon]